MPSPHEPPQTLPVVRAAKTEPILMSVSLLTLAVCLERKLVRPHRKADKGLGVGKGDGFRD